ncbi:hypothetical protein ACFLTP_00755 [Chloroflexota bacterium]
MVKNEIYQADITGFELDVLVNTVNNQLSMGGVWLAPCREPQVGIEV